MKKLNTRLLKQAKRRYGKHLNMLTAYDYQTATLLNTTDLDLILVGDSLGNVILGYDTTVEVSLDEMIVFASAVKRGAPNKFVVADMPFGTYTYLEQGLENATKLFQHSRVEAIKIEGASKNKYELIRRLTENGVAVMGHLGLTPQSVHEQGGYYTHGKDQETFDHLLEQAIELEQAGCFAIVLECVTADLAQTITNRLEIPTIGIGSGEQTDGQVLVINDLLKMGAQHPPSFCKPVADLYTLKHELISEYLNNSRPRDVSSEQLQ